MNENTEKLKELVLQFGKRAVQAFKDEQIEALTPARVDNYLSMLSAYSAMLEERLGELEVLRATDFPTFRINYKSNADATMFWESTPEGIEMIQVKRHLKSVDKIISACKNRLRRLENEALNRY